MFSKSEYVLIQCLFLALWNEHNQNLLAYQPQKNSIHHPSFHQKRGLYLMMWKTTSWLHCSSNSGQRWTLHQKSSTIRYIYTLFMSSVCVEGCLLMSIFNFTEKWLWFAVQTGGQDVPCAWKVSHLVLSRCQDICICNSWKLKHGRHHANM